MTDRNDPHSPQSLVSVLQFCAEHGGRPHDAVLAKSADTIERLAARAEAAEAERDKSQKALDAMAGAVMSDPASTETLFGKMLKANLEARAAEKYAAQMARRAKAIEVERDRLLKALHAIIQRSENGELGTSKVQDIKTIARAALNAEGG